jgi:hypothetical protein
MPYHWRVPALAAAALLFVLACDDASETLSPPGDISLTAGNDRVQGVSGHAVVQANGFNVDYTFTAELKNGVVSGHIVVFTNNGGPVLSIEGDVDCLTIDPGTTHARMSARVTKNDGIAGTEMYWNVTDGGPGLKAPQDGASPVNVNSIPAPFCATELAEQSNAANFIRVKL